MNEFRERTIEQDSTTIDDSFYNVVLFNDDVTPFEYLIMVLNRLFGKSIEEGVQISMHIHQNGKGVVATLSLEEAYAKLEQLDVLNDTFGFILQGDVEKAA